MGRYAILARYDTQTIKGLLVYGSHSPRRMLDAGPLVRGLRVSLLMSQRQLAQRSRVPQPAIAQIERGARGVTVETLKRLLDALFCDLVLVPRPRRHFGDLRHERAETRIGDEAFFNRPSPLMWKAQRGP